MSTHEQQLLLAQIVREYSLRAALAELRPPLPMMPGDASGEQSVNWNR